MKYIKFFIEKFNEILYLMLHFDIVSIDQHPV